MGENLDAEMAEMAKEELSDLKKKDVLEDRIKILLLPKDPNDDKKHYHGNSRGCGWR